MDGYAKGRAGYDYGAYGLSQPASSPNSNRIAAPNGASRDVLPYNPAGSNQVPRTARVDLKDPIQIHLLTETALSDSKTFEILTQEEVDEMKKQSQVLSQRVESTRTNLAIQSKYRDAAVSMTKLYDPGDPNLLEAEREREACERKCQELAAELFNQEKRLMVPQRRLLEHTAGILQLTHRASQKRTRLPNGQLVNGIPGSPESLYTFSQGRDSLEQAADEDYFEDPSIYQLDSLDGIQARGLPRKNAIEIPMKSPIREQNQLRGEMDRVREENMQLRGQMDMFINKLEGLNRTLRDTIVRFNPDVNGEYLEAPRAAGMQDLKPAALLKSQIEYLESGLVAVQAEQESFVPGGRDIGERLEALNLQVRDLLMSSDPHYTPTPIPTDIDIPGQLAYLEGSLRLADSQLGRALSRGGQDAETGPVLTGLWDSIQKGLVEARKRKEERRRTRADKGVPDEEEASGDEEFDPTEPYSLASFSSRVQWLHSQASTLKDQKSVLKRQIKQQRELNNKSDAEKDEELSRKQEELEQSRQSLARAEKEAMNAQAMLSDARQDLEKARGDKGAAESAKAELQQRNAKIEALEAKLRDVETNLATAEAQGQGAGQKLANMDSRIASLTEQKDAAETTAQSLRKELEEKTAAVAGHSKAMKVKEDELELLNMTLAELKTEVTIARAELDGAYGSRAERAADVAALKNGAEMQKLQNQVEKLKKELGETVQELEGITKEMIGSEREKAELETKLDEALSAKAALDAEVQKSSERMSKLQEELDGERLKAAPGPGNGARPGAGASMLSEQFRATMREERKKFQEDLREERTRCRRLEEELNRLKRSQGPGKSPLSPR